MSAIPRRRRRTGAPEPGVGTAPGSEASDAASPVGGASARTTLLLTIALLVIAAGSAVVILTR